MQLVLLRDWQRVLIRASLFPREVNKPGIVKLYGVHWKLLSLHLACALQPPPKVVSLLLSASASSTPVEQRKKIRIIPSWNFLSTSSPEDEKELLTTRDEYADLDDISIETTTTNHRGESWINNNNMSRLQGSLVSFEQSIGDWNSTASQTIGGTALDASLCSYLDKNDVVLQLTESGGVSPMHALQSKDTLSMSEETSLEFQEEPLIQAATETKTMLPIHSEYHHKAHFFVLYVSSLYAHTV